MHRDDLNPSKYSLICSDHFLEKDIDRTGQNVRVRANAIPVRFQKFPSRLKKVYKLWWKHLNTKHTQNVVASIWYNIVHGMGSNQNVYVYVLNYFLIQK